MSPNARDYVRVLQLDVGEAQCQHLQPLQNTMSLHCPNATRRVLHRVAVRSIGSRSETRGGPRTSTNDARASCARRLRAHPTFRRSSSLRTNTEGFSPAVG